MYRDNLFLAALDTRDTLILDGGLATELENQGHDLNQTLWSAALLISNPEAIINAHLAYLAAGADCIISASYQASRAGLLRLGLTRAQADAVLTSSVELARTAVGRFLDERPDHIHPPLVAASVGPYGATVHDGSEYTGQYDIGVKELREFHAERLAILDAAGADVLACETIPNVMEALVLSELLANCQTPSWISFCCRDELSISDGTPLRTAARGFSGHRRVAALGVNCTAPQFIGALLDELRHAAPDKALIAYPNSGERYDVSNNSWRGTATPVECGSAAVSWRGSGARIIGGCCRMGPTHINQIRRSLEEPAHSKKP